MIQKAAVEDSSNKLDIHAKKVKGTLMLYHERVHMRKEEYYSLQAHHFIIDHDTSKSNNLVRTCIRVCNISIRLYKLSFFKNNRNGNDDVC